jgi:hypothetical protein
VQRILGLFQQTQALLDVTGFNNVRQAKSSQSSAYANGGKQDSGRSECCVAAVSRFIAKLHVLFHEDLFESGRHNGLFSLADGEVFSETFKIGILSQNYQILTNT